MDNSKFTRFACVGSSMEKDDQPAFLLAGCWQHLSDVSGEFPPAAGDQWKTVAGPDRISIVYIHTCRFCKTQTPNTDLCVYKKNNIISHVYALEAPQSCLGVHWKVVE